MILGEELIQKSNQRIRVAHSKYLNEVNNYDTIQMLVLLSFQFIKLYLFYWVFYKYMKSLDEAECSCATKHKFHKYLKYFFFAMNIIIIYNITLNVFRLFHFNINTPKFVYVIQMLMIILSIISLIFVLIYLSDTDDCSCSYIESEDKINKRSILYYYSIIILSFVGISMLYPYVRVLVASSLNYIKF